MAPPTDASKEQRRPAPFTVVHVEGISKQYIKEHFEKIVGAEGVERVITEKFNFENCQQISRLACINRNTSKKIGSVELKNQDLALMAFLRLNKTYLKGKEITVFFDETTPLPINVIDRPPYTIGHKQGYKKFIDGLREELANGKSGGPEHIHEGRGKLLPEQQLGKQPGRWIHIHLRAKKGNETSVTTLVTRDDNLYVKGFRNQDGTWFQICGPNDKPEEMLPDVYNAIELERWSQGDSYSRIMKLNDAQQADRTLASTRLGKAFAARAVRRLSRYQALNVDDDNDDIPVGLGLAGLIAMICEAARMDAFLDYFTAGDQWNRGKGLTEPLIGHIRNWGNMSAALLTWKYGGKWEGKCGVHTLDEALDCVHLVLKKWKVEGSAGSQIEILAISANSRVYGIKVIGQKKHEQQIYALKVKGGKDHQHTSNKEESTHMQELKLNVCDTVRGKGISGYELFSIRVKFPPLEGSDDGKSIEKSFELDCRKVKYGDATQRKICTIPLDNEGSSSSSSSRKITVEYLVMSNAVEAIVELKLWYWYLWKAKLNPFLPLSANNNGGGCFVSTDYDEGRSKGVYAAYGTVIAYIGGFERHPIVLFRREKKDALIINSSPYKLTRSVQVPHGERLYIDIRNLHVIVSCRDQERELGKPDRRDYGRDGMLTFCFGDANPTPKVNNYSEVEVNVDWKTEEKIGPDPECGTADFIIHDGADNKQDFNQLIQRLRREEKTLRQDVDNAFLKEATSTERPIWPVIDKPLYLKWIHTKIQVKGEEMSSTTLVIMVSFMEVMGFMNGSGVWYNISEMLPTEYNSVPLKWGCSFKSILRIIDRTKDSNKLRSVKLGKKFAKKAVRTLSRYPDVEEGHLNPRLALAGLMIMVCGSASSTSLFESFGNNWNKVDRMRITDFIG